MVSLTGTLGSCERRRFTAALTTAQRHTAATERLLTAVVLVVGCAFSFGTVSQIGVPALRHDWSWPIDSGQSVSQMLQSLNGWATTGFGHPNAVLTAYYVEPVLAGLRALLGSHLALLLYVFAIGVCIAAGASSIGTAAGAPFLSRTAVAVIATFNPWTYNEVTAGHLNMVLSFGATLCVIAEILRAQPRPVRTALFLALAYVQLQFFLIDSALVLSAAALRRTSWLPVWTAAAVAAPSLVGLLSGAGWVASTAFLRPWQITQSVPPGSGWLFGGYFASYAAQLPSYSTVGLEIFAVMSLAALPLLRRAWEIAIVAIGGSAFLLSTGLRGPISGLYDAFVTHVIAAGLFRELYDLLAYLLIAYIVLFSVLARRFGVASYGAAAAAVLAFGGWIAAPPAHFWIDGMKVGVTDVKAPAGTRFALMPAFQPLRFDGQGSGVDPDAFSRSGRVESLNEYRPRYPADAALALWLERHNAQGLELLSVSLIVQRPRFSMDSVALRQTLGLWKNGAARGPAQISIAALPELSLISAPQIVALPPSAGDGNIFFADLSDSRGGNFAVTRVPPIGIRADQSWVDVSLQFVTHPEIAQGIGGAYTTSRESLPILPGEDALVDVKGVLRDGFGRSVARNTRGYAWVTLRRDSTTLTCEGECVVVGQGFPPSLDPQRKAHTIYPLVAQWNAPWFASIIVPPHRNGAVRYNATFAPGWIAVEGPNLLPHVRLDTATNGWLIAPAATPRRMFICYWPAAVQAMAEPIAILWLLWLLIQNFSPARHGWAR